MKLTNIGNVFEMYSRRKFAVLSCESLMESVKEFYSLSPDSCLVCDNFSDFASLSREAKSVKAIYYKPRFGFLGEIEKIKKLCTDENLIFIEDFTESFSANKILDGKPFYAGMFGTLSLGVLNGVFIYLTDDENLAKTLRRLAKKTSTSQKDWLLDFIFTSELEKNKRRVVAADYTALFAYYGLLRFLKPLNEVEGEAASFPFFVVKAKNALDLLQYAEQNGVQVAQSDDWLLLPTDVTGEEQQNIAKLICNFYKE